MPSAGTGSSLEPAAGRPRAHRRGAALEPLVTMLAADVLALHVEAGTGEEPVALEIDGSPVELQVLSTPLGEGGRLLLAIVVGAAVSGEASLTIGVDGERAIGPAPLRSIGVDLRSFLRQRLAPLPAAERAAVLELLVDAASEPGSRDQIGFSASMALAREGLREPLPTCVVERDEPQGLHFDSVVALSEHAFYLRGWVRDGQAELTRLTAVSPEGSRVELLPDVFRNPRPDVDSFYEQAGRVPGSETGFLGYCETRAPSYLSRGWVLEMENALGTVREVAGPAVTRDPLAARAGILSDLHKERHCDTPLLDHAIRSVERIQARIDEQTEIAEVRQYGECPRGAETSVVVPLYGRIDFLEHQLAQFVHDPELRGSDLIYVLDSPDLAAALDSAAGQLFELYGVPFRTVELTQNGGYSVANNRGASLASGRLLLLLNSDVLPDRPGWLSQLARFYDAEESIGALGPKLLFEDDTLQHAGICFQRPPGGGAWENEHFYKGLHRDLPAANVSRRVPAVSGACMMIRRDLYEEVDGLRGMYVQGDYEDTDLCLRLRERGLESWYVPEVELYHLEGQSYALETRNAMSRYNVWLHNRIWGEQIAQTMRDQFATGFC